jgi:ATP-dependent DNA ligase
MEALAALELPAGAEWQYEPKWDGFRALATRREAEIEIQSKSGQPLARYFPDMASALAAPRAKRFTLDGELVIPIGRQLCFEELQLRLHPAASRVNMLAARHPALYLVFDLLEDDTGASLVVLPLRERRKRLEVAARCCWGFMGQTGYCTTWAIRLPFRRGSARR